MPKTSSTDPSSPDAYTCGQFRPPSTKTTARGSRSIAGRSQGSVRSSVKPQARGGNEGSSQRRVSCCGEQGGRGRAAWRDRCPSGAGQRPLRRPGGGRDVHRPAGPLSELPETGKTRAQLVPTKPAVPVAARSEDPPVWTCCSSAGLPQQSRRPPPARTPAGDGRSRDRAARGCLRVDVVEAVAVGRVRKTQGRAEDRGG